MKKYLLLSMVLVLVLPMFLMLFKKQNVASTPNGEQPTHAEEMEMSIVSVLLDGNIQQIPLEEYIAGVVLAEMPANFHSEALKAQAVVARTYTCRKMENNKHGAAAVCGNSTCCQAYMSAEEYLKAGGSDDALLKIENAVFETAGQVLTYEGKLIEATYFSCSGGKTENAVAVWGAEVPYLQSVDSPGEESASRYIDTIKLTKKEFCERLDILQNATVKIGEITYTEGGGVEKIIICGKSYSGTELRSKLELRSTAFVITVVNDTVTITTKGYGHRVGMSQYGANAMAEKGSVYSDILTHYYQGVKLECMSG